MNQYENEKMIINKIVARIGMSETLKILDEIGKKHNSSEIIIHCCNCKNQLSIENRNNSVFIARCGICEKDYIAYFGKVRTTRQNKRYLAIRSYDSNSRERLIEVFNCTGTVELKSKDSLIIFLERISNIGNYTFKSTIVNETVSNVYLGKMPEEGMELLLDGIHLPSESEIRKLPPNKDPHVICANKINSLYESAKNLALDAQRNNLSCFDTIRKIVMLHYENKSVFEDGPSIYTLGGDTPDKAGLILNIADCYEDCCEDGYIPDREEETRFKEALAEIIEFS